MNALTGRKQLHIQNLLVGEEAVNAETLGRC